MKKYVLLVFLSLVIVVFACKKKNSYDNLPKPLAELCQKIDKDPDNSQLYYDRAVYYYDNGFMDEGFKDITQAIKIDSAISKYYVLLSDFYFSQKETDLSEESLEKAIALEPGNNEARLKLGELYFHLNMLEDCIATVEEAIRREEYNPNAYLIRAFCYKEMQDTTNMLRLLHRVIDQNPKEKKAYLELGYYYQMQNNPIAVDYYKNALNYYPQDIEINYNLARLYLDLKELDLAKEQYNYIVSFAPNDKVALNQLGYIYLYYEDKYDDAIRYFTQAISIDSTFTNAICNRGLAFELKQEYDYARQDYSYCRQIDPNFEPALKGLNRIDKIK